MLLGSGGVAGLLWDGGRARAGYVLLAARVVVALYDELCAHDEPHTPDGVVEDAFDDDPPARRSV